MKEIVMEAQKSTHKVNRPLEFIEAVQFWLCPFFEGGGGGGDDSYLKSDF